VDLTLTPARTALVLNMELSATPVARSWDAESFIAEIGARHGPDAAAVVGALVDWAGQKEDAIRQAGTRDRQLTDFDLPRAVDPTMYVGLSFFDRQFKPQWLFSIHAATAAIDISFQYMGHPPFDSEAGREPLQAMLNEITGVDIPAGRLRGRPRIPLAALVDPTSLTRLIAVLDRIVDETRPAEGTRRPIAPHEIGVA